MVLHFGMVDGSASLVLLRNVAFELPGWPAHQSAALFP
jgi:hypothetical protein